MSVRKALAESRNTIAVDVLERVGIEPAREFAARVGVTSTLVDNFTLALGSSEMTTMEIANTFATFASGGLFAEPVFVLRIEGGGGELLFSHTPASKRVISAELAYVMTSLLRSVVTEGTAKAALAKWEHPAAGKTGTSNGPKDTWFVGYTAYLTAAVYVGHDEPRELGKKEGGGKTALPIWADFMRAAHAGRQVKAFAEPPGLVHARIVPESGLLAPADAAKTLDEVFLPGTAPTQQASGEGLGSSDWALKQYEESNENPAEPPTEEIVGNPDGSASGDEF